MKKTKIICTMGPNSDDREVMKQLVLNGMDVARFNFSHGNHEEHKKRYLQLRQVAEETGIPVAALLDTKGPEIRTGILKDGNKITLKEGQEFTLTTEEVVGDETMVHINYDGLNGDVKAGDRILIDDGLIELHVREVQGPRIVCLVVNGGELGERKGVNVPGVKIKLPALTEKDKDDIRFGMEMGFDYIAASFIRSADAIREIREILAEGGSSMGIIAKIENEEGLENLDDIIEESDGIMVARGDLGVEIPFVEVPAIQKQIVSKCRMLGKRVIVATEMLESMIHNIRPTRAEISDVANAVYEGASAVMLSGESAAGKYPVDAVRTMAEVAEYTEEKIDYRNRFRKTDFTTKNILDAISHSACQMAIDVEAKCVIVSSVSGLTARMVSRFRNAVPIIGTTIRPKVYRKLALSWGVIPVLCEEYESMDVLFFHAMKEATRILNLEVGDNVIMMGGKLSGITGNTNMIKFETIKRIYE